jgi:hypothetical protein
MARDHVQPGLPHHPQNLLKPFMARVNLCWLPAHNLIDLGAVAPFIRRQHHNCIVNLGVNRQHTTDRPFRPFLPQIKGVFVGHWAVFGCGKWTSCGAYSALPQELASRDFGALFAALVLVLQVTMRSSLGAASAWSQAYEW